MHACTQVTLPFTHKYEYVKEFKQAPRREDDIAIVNAGMRIRMEQVGACFGGLGGKRSETGPAACEGLFFVCVNRAGVCKRVLTSVEVDLMWGGLQGSSYPWASMAPRVCRCVELL